MINRKSKQVSHQKPYGTWKSHHSYMVLAYLVPLYSRYDGVIAPWDVLNIQEHLVTQIWIKVKTWWQILPQHQSTYLGGPESASIEIPPFRPFLPYVFWKKIKIKIFRIAPKFFFALQYIKNWTKVVTGTNFFVPEKKIVSLKKNLLNFYEVRSERGDFNWCWFWAS